MDEVVQTKSIPPLFITIFLGANDSCLPPSAAHVPLPEFEEHLRYYVDTILESKATQGTKVILISPPPINLSTPSKNNFHIPNLYEARLGSPKAAISYRTYLSKRGYAEKVMEIAKSYEAKTNLVAGIDLWIRMIEYGQVQEKQEHEANPETNALVETGRDEDALPGSGLAGAYKFSSDVFLDGLHLGPLGYDVLSTEILGLITTKWPEIAPETLRE
ncbi:MAG: hypothetical protein M1834_004203 [Cirrosporium novae-zelandiae]|nr:MAG: hypothetical protein M1834_004203 [Cirrosporium novae-zelandiae]